MSTEIKVDAETFVAKCFDEGTENTPELLTKYLLQEYAEDPNNFGKDISQLQHQLREEGPRQVCQYQFKKNDIVWMCKNCQRRHMCHMQQLLPRKRSRWT